MHRTDFTEYDEKPPAMVNYLRHYGPHFSKRLCEFAVSLMTKGDGNPIKPFTKDDVNDMMRKHGVQARNDQMYDSVYVANMCVADYLGSSISDEKHMALYVKDVIDDPDAPDGTPFNRWYADMCHAGIAIDWLEML